MNEGPTIVSACLLGVKCRYDGTDARSSELIKKLTENAAPFIPVCPEQLGGLPTPRAKAEITVGTGTEVVCGQSTVVDSTGSDITGRFIAGALETLNIARLTRAKKAILKELSPSCGLTFIKRGGQKIPGPGVTTALLIKEGIKVEGRY